MTGLHRIFISSLFLMSALHNLCLCAPTTQGTVTSAERWMSPCHPSGSIFLTALGLSSPTPISDETVLNIVINHINEVQRGIMNLTIKYETSRVHSDYTEMTLTDLEQLLFNGFPSINELRRKMQQPMRQNFTDHLIEDFEILSVMAVYVEQAIKDEDDITEFLPLWKKIEDKLMTILCNFHKALTKYQQQIDNHVNSNILDDCTNGRENVNCRTMSSRADKHARDYIILRTTSSIFEVLKQKYALIIAN